MSDVAGRDSAQPSHRHMYDRSTLIDPREMRARRARWPRWRKLIRPLGLTLWWGGGLLALIPGFDEPRHGSFAFVLSCVLLGVIALCVVVGVGLEWRDRRREGRSIFG